MQVYVNANVYDKYACDRDPPSKEKLKIDLLFAEIDLIIFIIHIFLLFDWELKTENTWQI